MIDYGEIWIQIGTAIWLVNGIIFYFLIGLEISKPINGPRRNGRSRSGSRSILELEIILRYE